MKSSNRNRLYKLIPLFGILISCGLFFCFSQSLKNVTKIECIKSFQLGHFHTMAYQLNPFFSAWPLRLNATNFTVGSSNDNLLFYIVRTTNPHNICYDVNLTESGKLNVENPMDIYWIKNENGQKRIPVNWVERTFGYGIKVISLTEEQLIFQFVAYDKRNFHLKRDKFRKFRVYTSSKGRQIELSKLHIHVTGGSILVPKISKIEVHGKDIYTGVNTIEIVPM